MGYCLAHKWLNKNNLIFKFSQLDFCFFKQPSLKASLGVCSQPSSVQSEGPAGGIACPNAGFSGPRFSRQAWESPREAKPTRGTGTSPSASGRWSGASRIWSPALTRTAHLARPSRRSPRVTSLPTKGHYACSALQPREVGDGTWTRLRSCWAERLGGAGVVVLTPSRSSGDVWACWARCLAGGFGSPSLWKRPEGAEGA